MTAKLTNVKSIKTGRGVATGLTKDLGKFAVTTMEIPWKPTLTNWAPNCQSHYGRIHELEVLERDCKPCRRWPPS